ncbi:MAG: hypothetical protein IJL70_03820 [Treponema sp.]|nr:hypothetical protein [Treponema sp.]
MENALTQNQRNYGIDLLRILAMYMVVVLHVLGCGGILENWYPQIEFTFTK